MEDRKKRAQEIVDRLSRNFASKNTEEIEITAEQLERSHRLIERINYIGGEVPLTGKCDFCDTPATDFTKDRDGVYSIKVCARHLRVREGGVIGA